MRIGYTYDIATDDLWFMFQWKPITPEERSAILAKHERLVLPAVFYSKQLKLLQARSWIARLLFPRGKLWGFPYRRATAALLLFLFAGLLHGQIIHNPPQPVAEIWNVGNNTNGAGTVFTQNQTTYYSFTLPIPISAGGILYRVITADNTATFLYDIGIYSLGQGTGTSGQRLLHTGAVAGSVAFPSAAMVNQAFTGGALVLQPGTYLIAITSNCTSTCGTIAANANAAAVSRTTGTGGVTTNGVLLATISPTAISMTNTAGVWWFALRN